MRLLRILVLGLGLLCALPPAAADEEQVKRGVEMALPGAKVLGVRKTPYLGLYEVQLEDALVYTDEQVTHIFVGAIYDGRTLANLTKARAIELLRVDVTQLPYANSFKIVRGQGTRQLINFSDPRCPYCKQLEQEIQKLDDVTVHVFMLPILGDSSLQVARKVWCAPDRAKAWQELMLSGVVPTNAGDCETPMEQNLQLGAKLKITGTPTVLFANGERLDGLGRADVLEQKLNAVKPVAPKPPAPQPEPAGAP